MEAGDKFFQNFVIQMDICILANEIGFITVGTLSFALVWSSRVQCCFGALAEFFRCPVFLWSLMFFADKDSTHSALPCLRLKTKMVQSVQLPPAPLNRTFSPVLSGTGFYWSSTECQHQFHIQHGVLSGCFLGFTCHSSNLRKAGVIPLIPSLIIVLCL